MSDEIIVRRRTRIHDRGKEESEGSHEMAGLRQARRIGFANGSTIRVSHPSSPPVLP
jgi:hypothetical protein